MILEQCPHCGTRHVDTSDLVATASSHRRWSKETWKVQECRNPKCGGLILVRVRGDELLGIYPTSRYELPSSSDICPEIREEYQEAGTALDAGCSKSSMVMSRRVLQRVLKEQGCQQRNLVDQINHAIGNDILRKSFHEMANEIRAYGNLSAHPDDDQLTNCTKENAQELLEFIRLLIEEFYELPARIRELRKKRTDAKGSQN